MEYTICETKSKGVIHELYFYIVFGYIRIERKKIT